MMCLEKNAKVLKLLTGDYLIKNLKVYMPQENDEGEPRGSLGSLTSLGNLQIETVPYTGV